MGERSDPFFFLWTVDGKNCLSCWGCTYSVNENEELFFFFETASVWKYMIGSVSRWIVVSMCLSICESLRNQGEQEEVWVLEMESYQWVWDWFVEHRRQGPHQMVYVSYVFIGPLLFGYSALMLWPSKPKMKKCLNKLIWTSWFFFAWLFSTHVTCIKF
jgi:hypothetical protein